MHSKNHIKENYAMTEGGAPPYLLWGITAFVCAYPEPQLYPLVLRMGMPVLSKISSDMAHL